jgi:hypothetical protein
MSALSWPQLKSEFLNTGRLFGSNLPSAGALSIRTNKTSPEVRCVKPVCGISRHADSVTLRWAFTACAKNR